MGTALEEQCPPAAVGLWAQQVKRCGARETEKAKHRLESGQQTETKHLD